MLIIRHDNNFFIFFLLPFYLLLNNYKNNVYIDFLRVFRFKQRSEIENITVVLSL